ncbi:MAG: polysaccharide export protein [Candidatus Thiodiazotropha sp. (ex. Lucinisca nassula)]|nr:polysaccharide export protein [Candidatus Thiodiazotropha sp. (ex. Lucinisca nassula)]MBW9263250.1 polysaccharide export protein [Candidatus Thiodiazotropha sp. (ex. Lucinisca nassula)]
MLLTACSSTPEMNAATSAGGGSTGATSASSPLYLIGPGDTLNVFVWGDQELTTDVVVRPDGLITTPLVEDLQASGKTPTELARNLEARLSKFVKNPKVTVSVRQFVGRYTEQVRVVGQASQPQSLPFREGMTLLDVIIEVGGLTEFASGNSATIVRKIDGKTSQYRVRLDDLIRDGDISANVRMMPGDVLIIPETWF